MESFCNTFLKKYDKYLKLTSIILYKTNKIINNIMESEKLNSEAETVSDPNDTQTQTQNTIEETIESGFKMDLERAYEDFDKMGLRENLLRGIFAYGFEKPSRVQQLGIVKVSSGQDIICQSQSGTGKTATFSIGAVQRIDLDNNQTQILILAPTRELAKQIKNVISSLSNYLGVTTHLCIGGESLDINIKGLDKGAQVVVGTPGRVYDLLKRYILKADGIKALILDEADEMLSRGFKEQMYDIFQYLPQHSQVALFSATIPEEVLELSQKFMTNPLKVLIKSENLTLDGIKQFYIAVEKDGWKFNTLCDIYSSVAVNQAIIYCNTRRKAEWLTAKLLETQFVVSCIHSDMTQHERSAIMSDFRTGNARVMIATDIISRGIDVQQVSLVINYDMPKHKETYIHRIGRSGRYGRKGLAINFVTNYDYNKIEEISTFYTTEITELPNNFESLIEKY